MPRYITREGEDPAMNEELYAVPGTRRYDEKEHDRAQQNGLKDVADGLAMTGVAGAARTIGDEAPAAIEEIMGSRTPVRDAYKAGGAISAAVAAVEAAGVGVLTLAGYRAGDRDYNKMDKYAELTKGVPFEYHDDIMENDNLAAAYRARNRVLSDLERGRRVAMQDSGTLAVMAGSLFDADLPLTFMSGGAYGAAKVARAAARTARVANLSTGATLRLSGAAQGLNAGLQAGVVVGAVDAAARETVGWTDIANMSLQSMLMGGTIGTAVKGDVRLSVQAAQEDFLERISKDAAEFREDFELDALHRDSLDDFKQDPDAVGGSVGAQAVGTTDTMTDGPVSGASPTNSTWISRAQDWRHSSGWAAQKAKDLETTWGKIATSTAFNLTSQNFLGLFKSSAATANFAAGAIFESGSGLGRGRNTAAVQMDAYHRRIERHLGQQLRSAQTEWAKANGATMGGSGYGISQKGMHTFNREVRLELNARRLGQASSRSPEVKRAADQYELAAAEALGIGRGKDGETPIDGFDGLPDQRGYSPMIWHGHTITSLIDSGRVNKNDLVHALAQGYRAAGMALGKDAEAVAKAVLHRAQSRAEGVDMSLWGMLTGDGKDFMRESMILGGVAEQEADAIMQRLVGAQHNRSKESFAKSRNDIDMNSPIPTTDGTELKVVDLLDNDLHGVWQRYTRQVSGAAALARHGITNRAQRREFIDAIRTEQRALGEQPVDPELLEAMFSHFDAGPVHGYALGVKNEGLGVVALLKRAANLSLLEKLGVTQIAETGVIIARTGLENWMHRGPMAAFDKELRAQNRALLDDMAFMTGEIGQDHWHYAPWLDLDDMNRTDHGQWLHGVNKFLGKASFIQGYTSAFNQVRSIQQRIAALGVTDKIFRELKKYDDLGENLPQETLDKYHHLFGLDQADLDALTQLIASGTVEFATRGDHTFVNRLNMDKWDHAVADTLGYAVTRNMHQLVQRSLAGEQDAWMHTHMGSMFMHLKTFPLQAMQKQVLLNTKFMDKDALATVLYGMATAAVAVKVRDAIDGRERSAADTARAAVNYSNMTGFIPTLIDPLMTMAGMDGGRINPYGGTYDITPPVISAANDMYRIPGAVINTALDQDDWYDRKALRAIPFAGSYVLSRAFD